MEEKENKMSLKSLREEIDLVDDDIFRLVNKRFNLGKVIGELKEEKGSKHLAIARGSEIINRMNQKDGGLSKSAVRRIFENILAESPETGIPPLISFLGPEATFTHIAALNQFGHSADFVPQASIRDIFNEVEKGKCDYGVVPVENSIEGSVNYTLDLFFESGLKICAEKYQSISHDLLSISGKKENIRAVYSHPQPIGQCRRWLQANLHGIRQEECSSTSFAAKVAAEDPDAAAIASSAAASLYNLKVVAGGIEDFSGNTTRFLVVGKNYTQRTGSDKTSIMFVAPHTPGALYKVLAPIANSGINMLKLESRPTKHEKWSYFFFVDLEGHIEDKIIAETVEEIKNICVFMKFLGSYPMVVME